MQLADLFDLSLIGRHDRPALDLDRPEGGVETLTFGELDRRARRMALALMARSVRRGDRVAVQLANSIEFLEIFLACMKLGVVFVPINVMYRAREVSHIVEDAEPALAITTEDHLEYFLAATSTITIVGMARLEGDTTDFNGLERAQTLSLEACGVLSV